MTAHLVDFGAPRIEGVLSDKRALELPDLVAKSGLKRSNGLNDFAVLGCETVQTIRQRFVDFVLIRPGSDWIDQPAGQRLHILVGIQEICRTGGSIC